MFTVFQDSNNHIQIPFKGDFDYLLIKFTYRNTNVFGIFENTKGTGCDYEVNIIEVGSDGTVDKENGQIKLSPRSTWKAKIYGQADNVNLAPENATFLYDYDFQIKGDGCTVYPSGSNDCLPAIAIIEDQDGNVLATEEIPSGATETITINIDNPLYAYNYGSLNTGQDVSYAIGDDKWARDNIFNTEIESWPTNRDLVFPLLSDNPLMLRKGATPEGTNIFGNLERFTDTLGGQDYINDLVVDHYTGLMFYREPLGEFGYNWQDGLDFINNLTISGYDDFLSPNERIIQFLNIQKTVNTAIGSYYPLNLNSSIWSSTTSALSSSTSFYTFRDGVSFQITRISKTSNIKVMGCRKAFTYNPTQDPNKLILS